MTGDGRICRQRSHNRLVIARRLEVLSLVPIILGSAELDSFCRVGTVQASLH
jgi:hypothetical protein